jgi:transcriptional regulator with PAS, ATPase and Fis domain
VDANKKGLPEDGMQSILPVLARLCQSSVAITDRRGALLGKFDRDGIAAPLEQIQLSETARAVCQSRRPQWRRDEATGAICIAFPVGDRVLEIFHGDGAVRGQRSASAALSSNPGAFAAKYSWRDIVGSSPAITRVVDQAKAASKSSAPIFLTGESGTGKEMFAQAIHNASARSTGPFIAINCSTLPDGLVDSMLFGYVDGTFTGATKGGRSGLFEQASGGTLLLDEITEISVETQAKLLRVLQEREFSRIGSLKPIPVNIRIIATSNRDLHRRMREGLFREDLYYRLNVIDIHLPPLRDRMEDIPAIVANLITGMTFLDNTCACEVHPEAMHWLLTQGWPGNVRELRNLLERAVSLAETNVLMPHHFARTDAPLEGASVMKCSSNLSDQVAQAEERSILKALQRNNGHRGKTAAELGISVTTLWRRLREIGHVPAFL